MLTERQANLLEVNISELNNGGYSLLDTFVVEVHNTPNGTKANYKTTNSAQILVGNYIEKELIRELSKKIENKSEALSLPQGNIYYLIGEGVAASSLVREVHMLALPVNLYKKLEFSEEISPLTEESLRKHYGGQLTEQ